ncbi:MAG: MFS transporter, partial [Acidimicrobiia bacterium]|nr:MFS transporter [Acidimicrobiia bacterium]
AGLGVLRAVVGLPGMRNLQLAWLAVTSSDAAVGIALAVHAFGSGGAVAVGLMAAARTLPSIVAGPVLSVFVDRLSRREALAIGLAVRCLAVGAMVGVILAGAPLWVLYVAAAVDTAIASMFWPGVAALIPYLARSSRDLTTANAATSITESIGSLAGPVAAGIVVALASPPALLAVVGFILGGAGFLVWSVDVASDARSVASGRGLLREAVGGVTTLARSPGPALIVGAWTIESMVLGAVDVFIVVLAIDVMALGDAGVGYLTAVMGLGGVLGAGFMVEATRHRRTGATFVASLALMGVALVGIGGLQASWAVVGGLLAIGLTSAQIDVSAQTLVQRTVDDGELGRVLGTFEGFYWGSLGIGGLATAGLIALYGLEVAVATVGGALVLTALFVCRRVRRIDREVSVPDHSMRVLRQVPALALLSVPAVEHLARLAEPVAVPAGEVLIREGDHDDALYVISEGSFGVEANGHDLAVLGPGDMVGEVAAFRHIARTATVTARADSRVLRLPGDVVVATVSGHAPTAGSVESMIVGRMSRTAHGRRAGR